MSATEVTTAPLPTEEVQVETTTPVSDPVPETEVAPSTQVVNEVATTEAPVTAEVPAEPTPEEIKPESPSKKEGRRRLAKLFAMVKVPTISRNHKKEEPMVPATDDAIKKDEPPAQVNAEVAPADAEPAGVDQAPIEDVKQTEIASSPEATSEPTTQPSAESTQPTESAQTPSDSTQAPVTESVQEAAQAHKEKDEKKKDESRAAKVGRRLSARVGDFFKPRAKEMSPPPKVDEHPPKIDEPAFVAPLENPAGSEPAPVEEVAHAVEETAPVEPAQPPTPMVAAAA